MPGYYINFIFKDLCYDDDEIVGVFSASDCDVKCSFSYDRRTDRCRIWNNTKPVGEIEPLPIFWLLQKLKEKGKLKERESRICY